MTMPALPADGDTSWGNGDWAAEVHNRVQGNLTATTPSARTIGSGAVEAAAGNHAHSAATETAQGIVELATAAEVTAGTDNTRAVHPAGLKVELDKKAVKLFTTTSQSATSYTLALADAETHVKLSAATAVTVTVPPNASVAFPVGTTIVIRQTGTGQVTLAPGSGVTLLAAGGALKTAAQYAPLTLSKDATDTWYVDGYATT